MELEKSYDFSYLVNDTERMVVDELGKRLEEAKDTGICTCQDCVMDMAALALNMVKPRYHVSLLGTMYAHAAEEGEYAVDVRMAVAKAVARVRANPSHT